MAASSTTSPDQQGSEAADAVTEAAEPSRPRWRVILIVALLAVLGAEMAARVVSAQSSFGETLLPRLLDEHRDNAADRADAGIETDILFFGTSTAGAAFDPNLVPDQAAYDLWWAGAGTETLDAFAEGFALTLFDEAETVVIGITSREMNDARAAENAAVLSDATRSLSWRRVANRSALTQTELLAGDYSVLVRHRSDLRRPTSWVSWMFVNPTTEGLTTDETGRLTRYRDRPEPVMTEGDIAREELALADYAVGGPQADGLASLLRTLDGKRVLLVFLPVSYADYGPLHPDGRSNINEARDVVKQLAEEGGAEFLDASDLGEDRMLFGDANHLNQTGSETLTQRVLDYLDV